MSLPRCLVIGPDPEFTYILSGIVSRHGLDVDVGADPFAALRMLRMQRYDIVLYDVTPQDIDHDTFLATLRRDLVDVLDRLVLVTRSSFDSNRVPAGVPIIGSNDLKPLMRYLEDQGRK
jgi:CheY-like chemotaxis protein